MLILPDPPPTRETVWVCLGTPEPAACARAAVLEVMGTDRDADRTVRLEFRAPCPEPFYQTAIHGLAWGTE